MGISAINGLKVSLYYPITMGDKTLTLSEMQKIATEIEKKGFAYLQGALRDQSKFEALKAALSSPVVRKALIELLRGEGKRLLAEHKKSKQPTSAIPKMHSDLGTIVADASSLRRLRELMMTYGGREVLKAVGSTTEGDFLMLGYLFNTPGGQKLVTGMLISSEGRKTSLTILYAACSAAPDPYFLPKLPLFKVTADGQKFKQQLSSLPGTNELRASLITYGGKKRLLDFFTNKETEARSVLREILSTDAGIARVHHILISEQGGDFLEMLGMSGLGRRIAGDDLWLTPGGRKLLKKLLATSAGREAVFALITGF